jgi:hypothetical protein
MAVKGKDVELLVDGMNADSTHKGAYIQNMDRHINWKVRKGFGQSTQFDTTLGWDDWEFIRHVGSRYLKTNFGHEQIVSICLIKTFTGNLGGTGGGSILTRVQKVGQYITAYMVSIYDITTDEIWEEIVHPNTNDVALNGTAFKGSTNNMRELRGRYETYFEDDVETNLFADSDAKFFFEEVNDTLFFGDSRTGILAYIPAIFEGSRIQSTDGVHHNDWAIGYSESSRIRRVAPRDGDFADAYAYLTETEFPKPIDITSVLNRIVYVDKGAIYFSDIGNPTSIIADNVLQVASENPITAVQELNGQILIFTKSETFYYQPSVGVVVSAGRLQKVSNQIGCISPNTIVTAEGSALWVDTGGVYTSANGVAINTISQGIEKLFTDYISNPLSNFFNNSGIISNASLGALDQGNLIFRFDPRQVSVTFDHIRKSLIFAIPKENIAMIWNSGGWSIWNFESIAANTNPEAIKNIDNPWFVMGENQLYLIGSPDRYNITNAARFITGVNIGTGAPLSTDLTDQPTTQTQGGSYYILEYGRGGSPDRTVIAKDNGNSAQYSTKDKVVEDRRTAQGRWYSNPVSGKNPPTRQGQIEFGEWVPVKKGTLLPRSRSLNQNTVLYDKSFLIPVYFTPDTAWTPTDPTTASTVAAGFPGLPTNISLGFDFDNVHWAFYFRENNSTSIDDYYQINAIFPPERVRSMGGWGADTSEPVNGSHGIFVKKGVAGLPPTALGRDGWNVDAIFDYDQIRSVADYQYDGMNVNRRYRNLLFWLPIYYTGGNLTGTNAQGTSYPADGADDVMSAGITGLASYYSRTAPFGGGNHASYGIQQCNLYHFEPSYLDKTWRQGKSAGGTISVNSADPKQPIDWVYKSEQIGLEEAAQVKARSLWLRVKAHGVATTGKALVAGDCIYGQLNAVLGSDWKDWVSQFIDYQDTEINKDIQSILDESEGTSANNIRSRIYDASDVVSKKTFNNSSIYWGSDSASSRGNYLIDDEEYDTINMSTSVKGEYFSWMLFGHMQAPGESLEIDSAKATIRPAGGRRRKGR